MKDGGRSRTRLAAGGAHLLPTIARLGLSRRRNDAITLCWFPQERDCRTTLLRPVQSSQEHPTFVEHDLGPSQRSSRHTYRPLDRSSERTTVGRLGRRPFDRAVIMDPATTYELEPVSAGDLAHALQLDAQPRRATRTSSARPNQSQLELELGSRAACPRSAAPPARFRRSPSASPARAW